MKRSEINEIIGDAVEFLREHRFYLPPFAFWTPEDWATKGKEAREIVQNGLAVCRSENLCRHAKR